MGSLMAKKKEMEAANDEVYSAVYKIVSDATVFGGQLREEEVAKLVRDVRDKMGDTPLTVEQFSAILAANDAQHEVPADICDRLGLVANDGTRIVGERLPASVVKVELEVNEKTGKVNDSRPNIEKILTQDECIDSLRFDRFSDRTVVAMKGDKPKYLSDKEIARLHSHFAHNYGIETTDRKLVDSITVVADQNAYHPIIEYLDALPEWDGTPRLDTWLSQVTSTENTEYKRAIGKRVVQAMVERVMDPGCKFDTVMVLEGAQGRKKSTLVEALAGGEEFYIELEGDLSSVDTLLKIRGKWVVELGELNSVKGAAVLKTKTFISRKSDSYRDPYGRMNDDHPRQCVLVGTTNDQAYLRDPTGNRRWWPVETNGTVDVAWLQANRDQMFAEALHLRAQGPVMLWLSSELEAEAIKVRESRFESDVWEDRIEEYLRTPVEIYGNEDEPPKRVQRTIVQLQEILQRLDVPEGQQDRKKQYRIEEILTRLGWHKDENTHVPSGERIAHGGKARKKGWRAPKDWWTPPDE